MAPSAAAKFLILMTALTFVWNIILADDQTQIFSTVEPNVLPSFEEFNIPTNEFEIKFSNLHIFYKIAMFPTDKDVCENVFLFVFIPSRPASFEIRRAIRSSWIADRPSGIVVKFVIGLPKKSEVFLAVLEEQKIFGDLIFYEIEDTYENLLFKVHAAFNWQQKYCSKAEYVLKTDDDTVVDLHRLLYWIEHDLAYLKQSQPAIIFGGVWKGSIPHRNKNHKWYVSQDVFPSKRFPNYTNGATYLLSNEAVSTILSNTQGCSAFSLEDVLYTGVISEKAGIQREDVWKHFRRGDKIQSREPCDLIGKVPFITAIFGSWSAKEFDQKYRSLRAVSCDSFKKF